MTLVVLLVVIALALGPLVRLVPTESGLGLGAVGLAIVLLFQLDRLG